MIEIAPGGASGGGRAASDARKASTSSRPGMSASGSNSSSVHRNGSLDGPIGTGSAEEKPLTLKLTKYGLLSRKGATDSLSLVWSSSPASKSRTSRLTPLTSLLAEDLGEGGKKATNRKWKEWSVILTGSQLLFFKDPHWALVLLEKADDESVDPTRASIGKGRILLPKMASFKPDEVLSVKDSIAVVDTSYTKVRSAVPLYNIQRWSWLSSRSLSSSLSQYPNAFRFVMPHGRQYLLQASDEHELNQWMSRINYASTFRTAGVRMRGMGMTGGQAQLAGAAAAASHVKALKAEDHQGLKSSTSTTRSTTSVSSGEQRDRTSPSLTRLTLGVRSWTLNSFLALV
jgi:hypothetical protein